MIAFFRELIFHDFWLKLFSLALAVLIWLTISFAKEGIIGNKTTDRTFRIPVRVVSAAEDVSAFKPSPPEIEIKIRGATRRLQQLQDSDFHALVDLTGIPSALGLRRHVDIALPAETTILEVIPSEVEVSSPAMH